MGNWPFCHTVALGEKSRVVMDSKMASTSTSAGDADLLLMEDIVRDRGDRLDGNKVSG